MTHRHAMDAALIVMLAALTTALAQTAYAAGTASPPVKRYIVELDALPFALDPARRSSARAREALHTGAGRGALARIDATKAHALGLIESRLGRQVGVVHSYRLATVGFALTLDPAEADAVAKLAPVARVTADQRHPPPALARGTADAWRAAGDAPLDPVVTLIGADRVWDGSATGDAGHFGEGVVFGVTGTGIAGEHPSFAAVGGDGYQHVNPLGSGVYLGECFASAALTCNDKLIGRRTFTIAPDVDSVDEDGYSSFVASLAVGNSLIDLSPATPFVTGVAPHANIVAYRTCAPTCAGSDTIMAFEHAIADGVDVLLHVSGSSTQSPWGDPLALAARGLRAAGVSLAYLAGTTGPDPGSLNLSLAAPWVTTFAVSTHGRDIGGKRLANLNGGDQPPPQDLDGQSLTGPYSGPIVYAGDVPNPNDPGNDPAQCLQPYPAGTFAGQIVVCDRGQIPRVQKSVHVKDGGAGGFVLANVDGGLDTLATETYALPGIHLRAAPAQSLRAWLASGNGHQGTIALSPAVDDPQIADLLAVYSARGPNQGLSYLAPSLTAPAISVLGADIGSVGFQLSFAQGSAPGAGALALLKSVHPQWSPAQLQSALMSTAVAPLREQDGVTATGPFDHGGGRVDVAAAAQATLVMEIADDEFAAANPDGGGRPQALNLAGLVDLACVGQCSWTRRVQATVAGTWLASASAQDGIDVRVAPESFSLDAGQTQELTIDVSAGAALDDGSRSGEIVLVPQTPGAAQAPPSRLPLVVNWLGDGDGDGVANVQDNCLELPNADQRDTNDDGFGNRCDADLNDDGTTNVQDLGIMRARFFSADPDADLDGDGVVAQSDLQILAARFFLPPGPAAGL